MGFLRSTSGDMADCRMWNFTILVKRDGPTTMIRGTHWHSSIQVIYIYIISDDIVATNYILPHYDKQTDKFIVSVMKNNVNK